VEVVGVLGLLLLERQVQVGLRRGLEHFIEIEMIKFFFFSGSVYIVPSVSSQTLICIMFPVERFGFHERGLYRNIITWPIRIISGGSQVWNA